MKLKDTEPGQIYEATIEHFHSAISTFPPVQLCTGEKTTVLILVTNKPGRFVQQPVNYEYLASSDNLFYAIENNEEMTPVPDSNLPLYINYPLKTDKFYELLKGSI